MKVLKILKILKIMKIMKVSIMKIYIYQIKENYLIKNTKLIQFHIIQIILKILQVKEYFLQIIQILIIMGIFILKNIWLNL